MFKIIIVDDDVFARSNLKSLIEWEKNGFTIIGEASNGSNAIQLIKDERPDIVITDISMPVMDGINLIGYIEKECNTIKVIALSGYNDFDFVRQSMKKGAVDYILKHKLNSKELLDVLKIARNRIQEERKEISDKQQIQEQLKIGQALLKQSFIKRLVEGVITEKDSIKENIASLGLRLDTNNLALIIAEIDDFSFIKEKFSPKELNAFLQSFVDIIQEILSDSEKSLISHIGEGRFVVIFSFGNMRSFLFIQSHMMTVINRIKVSIKRYFNITASFSIGRACEDIRNLSKNYLEAETLLKEKFYKGKDNIHQIDTNIHISSEFISLGIKDEKNIALLIRTLDRDNLIKYLDQIFDKIYTCKTSLESTKMISVELINIINSAAKEAGIDISSVYQSTETPYAILNKYETIDDIRRWILTAYTRLISKLEALKLGECHSEYTKKTIEYIHKNYHRDISLNDAANYVGISSAYLSRVFKADCCIGFTEYLNQMRIEKAKLLIERKENRVKEIANQVGFISYNYFFKVFKDIVGMTPVEYEQTISK